MKVLKNLNGDELRTVSIINTKKSNKLLELSWFLFILFSGITIVLFIGKCREKKLIEGSSYILLLCLILIKQLVKIDPFNIISNIEFFQPNLFANPYIGNSLGQILINFLIVLITMHYWYQNKEKFTFIKVAPKSIQIVILGIYLAITFCLMSYTSRSLIIDSYRTISYNPFSDWFTFTMFYLLFFTVLFKFIFDLRIVKFIKNNFKVAEMLLISVIATIASGLFFATSFTTNEVLFLLVWQIVGLVVLFLLLENKDQQIKQISGAVLIFTLFSFFCAQNVKHYSFQKKRGEILQTARKLSFDEDSSSKFEIETLTEAIKNDPIIKSQITNPFITDQTIINRIEDQYISDELLDYSIEFDFDEITDSTESFKSFESRSDFGNYDYIARIKFQGFNQKQISIRFRRPKIDLDNSFYASEKKSKIPAPFLPEEFSYAVFVEKELAFLKGNINAPNWNKLGNLKIGDHKLFRAGQETTMYYQKDKETTILISIQEAVKTNQLLFLFTNFFGFLFFCFLVYGLFISGFKLTKFSFFKNSLANQIQYLVIFFLYLAGFVVTYSSFQVSKKQLLTAQQAIYQTIPNKLITDFKAETEPKDRDINTFREYLEFNVPGSPYDIHLFDERGYLVFTNKPKLFIDNVWPERIDPQIIQSFNEQPVQAITINEKIDDHEFYGFYKAIRFNDLELKGTLYLPGLDIIKKVTNRRNAIVNSQFNAVSIVLFILTFISLIISQSLTNILFKIRRQFTQVGLGDNQIIAWENEDEIGELVQEYNQMVKKLDENAVLLARSERQSAWRDVAKQVAHEIKNPLTPMKLSIQHLKRRITDSGDAEIDAAILRTLNSIETQTEHLSKIADNFSSITKMELPNFETINLVDEIEQSTTLYRNRENFTLEYNNLIPNDVSPLIKADKTMISRVIINLLKNAVQALVPEREGVIKLTLDGDDKKFIIIVTDNGKGIDSKDRAKIFTPNFTTKTSGTGIGLMMSKNIIELHKGTITFKSVKGTGTVFTIVLPKNTTLDETS